MKIVFATTSFPPTSLKGGIVTLYHNLALALKQKGHELLVLAYSEKDEDEYSLDGIRVKKVQLPEDDYQLLKEMRPALPGATYAVELASKLYLRCKDLVDEFAPDIIEVPEYCAMGLFWLLDGKYPVVARGVGPLYYFAGTGDIGNYQPYDVEVLTFVEMLCFSRCAARSAISLDLAKRLAHSSGVDVENIQVIKVPIDVNMFPRKTAKERTSQYPKMFYWGRIERQKGCDVLIEALPAIVKQYPSALLRLAGFENKEADALRPFADDLRVRIQELGLQSNVEFLGLVETDKIVETAHDADFCVFPARYETAGYTLLEAGLTGTCVVSTKSGGIPEYIEHGESGYLIDEPDAIQLSNAILTLCKEDSLKQHIEKSAYQKIKDACGYETIAMETERWYSKAIAEFNRQQRTKSNKKLFDLIVACLGTPSDRNRAVGWEHYVRGKQHGWEEAGPKCFSEGYEKGFAEGMRASAERSASARPLSRLRRKIKSALSIKK